MKKLLSKSILKQSIKNNWKLWAILTGVLCLFITLITFVSTSRRGGEGFHSSLISVYGMMMFGMMGILLMLIYAITAGNKLVASEVDKGTMSFTLNTPTTRKQIIFSKALYYVVSLILMAVLMGLFGTFSSMIAGVEMNYGTLWLLVLGFILFGLAISGISFAASCWFNKSGHSLLIGAGLPVAFYLFSTLSQIENLEFFKYFSLNTLFDTSAVIAPNGVFWWQFLVMGVVAVALYALGINKFLKKDLPL